MARYRKRPVVIDAIRTMARYRKRPVVIDAIRYDGPGPSLDDVFAWVRDLSVGEDAMYHTSARGFVIRTLEGDMRVEPGDWVIRGVKGEYYPCKPDIFEATYEAVTE